MGQAFFAQPTMINSQLPNINLILKVLELIIEKTSSSALDSLQVSIHCLLFPNLIEFEEMVGPQRPQFVLFGSSIVQLSYSNGGWGAHLSDIYSRKADIILRGYNGWNSRRGLKVMDQVFPKDAAVQPDLVIVYFGGNDSMAPHPSGLSPHVPLVEYIENMRKIALHLKSLSEKTRIIFLTCAPVNEEQFRISFGTELVRSNEDCQRYSNACLELCRDIGVKVVDLCSAIKRRDNWEKLCFIDGVHFSAEGSFIVVEEILKVLKEAEWEPSLYWKLLPTEFADLFADDRIHTINVDEWTLYREHWH